VLIPALVAAILILSFGPLGGPDAFVPAVFLIAFMFAAALVAVGLAVVAVPLTFFLAHRDWESVWIYPLVGLFTGPVIMVFLVLTLGRGFREPFEAPQEFLLGTIPGAVSGLIWWFSYRRSEQDRPAA
jgi:hypothetical protein